MSLKSKKSPSPVEYGNSGAELESLLKRNLELMEEINESVSKIKTYIFWTRMWWVFKLLIILIPFVLAFIYLPPLFRDLVSYMQEAMNPLMQLKEIPLNL